MKLKAFFVFILIAALSSSTVFATHEGIASSIAQEGEARKTGFNILDFFMSEDKKEAAKETDATIGSELDALNMSITTVKDTPYIDTFDIVKTAVAEVVYEIVYQPSHGTVEITNANIGEFTFTPDTNYTGEDIFTYSVSDNNEDYKEGIVTVSVIASSTEEPATFDYFDMGAHWAGYSVSTLAREDVMVGEKVGRHYYFYPDRVLTRSDFAAHVLAALNIDLTASEGIDYPFEDEETTPLYQQTVARAAYSNGIIKGIPLDGKMYYRPNERITRMEALTMLHNIIKPEGAEEEILEFSDIGDIPAWGIPIIKAMKAYGILMGYTDNTVRPDSSITRAMSAEFLMQVRTYIDAEKSKGNVLP